MIHVPVPGGYSTRGLGLVALTARACRYHHSFMTARIRLERQASVGGQGGAATAIGTLLVVIGVAIIIALRADESQPAEGGWVFYVVGVGFTAVGLLVAVLGIKTLLMLRIPQTILEVDRMPVGAGESFELTVRQPGPVRLASLRVNLVCEQTTRRPGKGAARSDRDQRIIHLTNMLNLGEAAAGAGEQIIRHVTVNVPAQVQLADIEGPKDIAWRLEVWGRVRGWANFGHPYDIEVFNPAEEEERVEEPATS